MLSRILRNHTSIVIHYTHWRYEGLHIYDCNKSCEIASKTQQTVQYILHHKKKFVKIIIER